VRKKTARLEGTNEPEDLRICMLWRNLLARMKNMSESANRTSVWESGSPLVLKPSPREQEGGTTRSKEEPKTGPAGDAVTPGICR